MTPRVVVDDLPALQAILAKEFQTRAIRSDCEA